MYNLLWWLRSHIFLRYFRNTLCVVLESGLLFLWTGAIPIWAATSNLHQAIVAYERGELLEAKACIDRVLEEPRYREKGATWYYRGVIYEKLLREKITSEEAIQLLEEILNAYRKVCTLTPGASQYHSFAQINLNKLWTYYLDRGRSYYRKEAFEQAIQQFTYCKQILPHNPQAYLYTAIAAHQDEKYDLAVRNYTHYVASDVTIPAAVYHSFAHLIIHVIKEPEQARTLLEQALLKYPFDNGLLHEQLQLYKLLGQMEEKLTHKQVTITASPQPAHRHYQLAYWYEQQNQWEKALVQYQKAAQRAPKALAPVLQQGIIYYNQAAQIADHIMNIAEDEWQFTSEQNLSHIAQHLRQALLCFEQANRLSPRNAFVLRHLEIIYRYLNQTDQAEKIVRRLRKYGF